MGDSQARLTNLQTEFTQILQVPRVFVRHQGTEHFISGSSEDTLNFHSHDTRAGTARYVWEERGDGVQYGFLKSDV
ncbi:MAG: hypothetical protein NVSMB9_01360 [Isosphaeraceae bacterium]